MRFSLLASLVTLLCVTPHAAAQTETTTCDGGYDEYAEAILGRVPPISDHYTAKVLERAEQGIAHAFEQTEVFYESGFMTWTESTFEALSKTIDTKIHLAHQARSLSEDTACLHIDLLLIESMMEKVRCKIEYAFERKQFNTIRQLKDVLLFLDEAYYDLVEGARYNAYVARSYPESRSFDRNPVWCCEDGMCQIFPEGGSCTSGYVTERACTQDTDCKALQLCPFHSDYLPPSSVASGGTVFGYGCDLNVLSNYSGITIPGSSFGEILEGEIEMMTKLLTKRDAFIDQSEHLKENATKLEEWLGRTPSPRLEYFGLLSEADREHITAYGCSVAPEEWGMLDEEGDTGDYDLNSLWPPIWPNGAIRWSTHGIFSFDRDAIHLLEEYAKLRTEWGRRRPLAYKLPDELSFTYFLQLYFRSKIKLWDIEQEQLTSSMVTEATDAPQRIIEQLTPLREAVGEFSTYASSISDGASVRDFALGLAYYLRRSCLTRPCNERLERILKVVLKDACFPYTSGNYSGNIWKECKKAAKLDEFADD